MHQETPPPPAEARLIRLAREATGMTAGEAAKSTNGLVSAVYWRDVERGHGTRRGERVPTRASARLLAHMARAVRVSPERLEGEGERPDAAGVLREMLREDPSPRPPFDEDDEGEPQGDEAWVLFPDDPTLRHVWRMPGDPMMTEDENRERRLAFIAWIREQREEAYGGGEGPRRQAKAG